MGVVKPKKTTQILPDGRMAFLDERGEIVAVQKLSDGREGLQKRLAISTFAAEAPQRVLHRRHTYRLNKNGVQFLLPLEMHDREIDNLPDDFSYFDGFRKTCTHIAFLVSEGKTLSEIGRTEGLPSKHTILVWAAKDEAFARCLDEARKFRAEGYADKIAHIAETVEEDTSKSAKVKIEAWKYLAEVGDRERFSTAAKNQGASSPVVNITFNTGIVREEIPAEGTVIEQTSRPTEDDS